MFSNVNPKESTGFLDKTKAAREERAQEKHKECSAIKIQALIRRYLARCKLCQIIRAEVDSMLKLPHNTSESEYKPSLKPVGEVFVTIKRFFLIYNQCEDQTRFEYLCKYLLAGMSSDNTKFQYVSLAVNKTLVLAWIQQIKNILWHCCLYFKRLKPENTNDKRMVTVLLHMLIMFTSCNKWKLLQGKIGDALKPGMTQLCSNVMGHLVTKGLYPCLKIMLINGLARSKPALNAASLTAIITIALRPIIAADFSDNMMTLLLLNILSVPAVVYHLNIMGQDCLTTLMSHRIFSKSILLLSNNQSARIVFNALEGNYALCLLANLVQLGGCELEGLVENTDGFMIVVRSLLESCKKYVINKKSNLTHWHPVLGWFSQKTDTSLHEAMPYVVKQLQQLWSMKVIKLLFEQLFVYNDISAHAESKSKSSNQKNLINKIKEKASTKQNTGKVKLDSPVLRSTCLSCGMYLTAIRTFCSNTQLKLEIMAGLCCQDILLPRLWKLISDLGPQYGIKPFIELLTTQTNDTSHMIFDLLQLSCDTAAHIVTILDDVEMYEQNKPFDINVLMSMSSFLNNFIFKSIWCGYLDVKTAETHEVFNSVHNLLMVLYERDCRRSYTPVDHWLIKDIKTSAFLTELERNKYTAQFLLRKVPHIIPHKERVALFRKNVSKEKDVLGLTESACMSPQSTLITVHRSRIIEDGYRQLAIIPPNALKGLIRVRFINEQGLDEAGIDQDGVFKEFLEETIKRVFDPSLNLFRVTNEQKLYPSPTSYIQENHLALFEFVGRMLGKAVYEGIVVEVPFAPFFLSQICGHTQSATYSSFDELPSLDQELYKSLTYIKHYDGDMTDLELTFCYDEDVMGKHVSHELIPGGKAMSVNNENKISYIHLMAHFKMRVQIKEQSMAFIHGFKSIVPSDWLSMFSIPELQKLISGDTIDIDLDDLRKHTQYYGGFHNNHRVVSWLWDVLEKDFDVSERQLFLRFVTSCSKPPLLGFTHLEPPFTIRCVEVSDDQDTGDTVGSILKGFFHIKKKDPVGRLPTSSTCFNLLKLPNYQKKSTLREKLRYAISSNTGFELS